MSQNHFLPETQTGHPLLYTEKARKVVEKMDQIHLAEKTVDESHIAFGAVDPDSVVHDVVTTSEKRLLLPDDFPKEIAHLIANATTLRLQIEPAIMADARLRLIDVSDGDESDKFVLLAFFNSNMNVAWEKEYKKYFGQLAQVFFESEGGTLLQELLDSAECSDDKTAHRDVQNTYHAVASQSWCHVTRYFQNNVENMVTAQSTLSSQELSLLLLHYHPAAYLNTVIDGSVATLLDLLTFSDADLRSFISSALAYIQIRVILEKNEAIERHIRTLHKGELKHPIDALSVLNQLCEQLGTEQQPTISQLIEFIEKYLHDLPVELPPGVEFPRLFSAVVDFFIGFVEGEKESWINKVCYGETHNIQDTLKPGLYRHTTPNLVLYHLTKLRSRELSDQKNFRSDFLLFLDQIDIFPLVAAIVQTQKEIQYRGETPANTPAIRQLAEAAYLTDVVTVKSLLRPYFQWFLHGETPHSRSFFESFLLTFSVKPTLDELEQLISQ